jgi:microcystin-dependent protein
VTQTYAPGQVLTAAAVNAELAFPTGSVIPYAGASAPSATLSGVVGWLLADGTAVSRTTYATLYAVVGTTYGAGDGSTTFNLPDMRGRMPIGAGNENVTGNNTARTRGVKGGDTRLQSHTHTGTTNSGSADIAIDSGGLRWGQQPNASGNGWAVDASTYTGGVLRPVYDRGHTHGFTTGEHNQSVGTGANMPPFVVLNYLIKT